MTATNTTNRTPNLDKLFARFQKTGPEGTSTIRGNSLDWGGTKPLSKYAFVSYNAGSDRHCITGHDDLRTVVREINQDIARWSPVFVVDLDTDEILNLEIEVKVKIEGDLINGSYFQ